jgi:hypothetical protein
MRTTVWGRHVVAGGVAGTAGTVRGSAVAVRTGWSEGCRIVREGIALCSATGAARATLAGFAMFAGLEGAGAVAAAVSAGASSLDGGCSRSASRTSGASASEGARSGGLVASDGGAFASLVADGAIGASAAGASGVRIACGSAAGCGAAVSTDGVAGWPVVCATGLGGGGVRGALLRIINSTVRSTGLSESRLVVAIAVTTTSAVHRTAWMVRGLRRTSVAVRAGRVCVEVVRVNGHAAMAAGAMTGC